MLFLFLLGWGTDEKAIISILGHRNAAQRKQIRLAYSELFQEDLVKRLESELTGDFEVIVSLRVMITRTSYLYQSYLSRQYTFVKGSCSISCVLQ